MFIGGWTKLIHAVPCRHGICELTLNPENLFKFELESSGNSSIGPLNGGYRYIIRGAISWIATVDL